MAAKSTLDGSAQQIWQTQLQDICDQHPVQVWQNTSNKNSLRLTVTAYKQLRVEFYGFKIATMTNHQLLQLDHLLQSPYYIKNRRQLYLMGQQDAILLQLHASNLGQYLHNLDHA